jgi:NTP pyrophosphatase (non-canonical NTP hydrolase)
VSYRSEVLRVAVAHPDMLGLATMGLAGECGEFVDLVKKHRYHGVPFDRAEAIKELGDVRWYFEVLCHCLDTTIEEVEHINTTKLRARYPDGFSTKASIDRKDVV